MVKKFEEYNENLKTMSKEDIEDPIHNVNFNGMIMSKGKTHHDEIIKLSVVIEVVASEN